MAPSPEKVRPALVRFLEDAASGLTACARDTFAEWYEPLTELDSRIERVTHRVERVSRAHPVCQNLAAVPGSGPLTATALVATVGPRRFTTDDTWRPGWGWCLGNILVGARSDQAGFRHEAVGLCGRCCFMGRGLSCSGPSGEPIRRGGGCARSHTAKAPMWPRWPAPTTMPG